MRSFFRRVDASTRSPRAILVSMTMSIACFALIVVVLFLELQQSKNETHRLADVLCGFTQPVSQLPVGSIPVQSQGGQALKDDLSQIVAGAGSTSTRLNCPSNEDQKLTSKP